MYTANHIRAVAAFSLLALLCLVLMVIDSRFGSLLSAHWTVFAFFCAGMIGLATYNSLKSIDQRLSDLESRYRHDATQL
jgi:hypothetical protein